MKQDSEIQWLSEAEEHDYPAAASYLALIHDDAPAFRVDLMPYGGVRDSGLGREGPRYAVEEMTEPRLLVLRR